ncbi:MAG: tetratricopeptide repeat protein [Anaerolineales bacterium]|nr:tetratricopeptide repeat protein [Anaerolineales bacterium]
MGQSRRSGQPPSGGARTIRCYDHALLVADALARRQPVQRTAYFVGKGDAADLLGDFETAVAHYQAAFTEALAAASHHDARGTVADLARRIGRLLGKLGRYAEAHRWMEQALQILGEVHEEADLVVAALVHTHTGSLYVWEDKLDAAELACRRALTLLGAWEHGSVTATAENVLGVVCEITGRWPEALDHFENSRQLWENLGDRHQQALVSDNLALATSIAAISRRRCHLS